MLSNLPVLMSYDKMQLGQNGAFRMHEQKERTVYNILGYATIIPFFWLGQVAEPCSASRAIVGPGLAGQSLGISFPGPSLLFPLLLLQQQKEFLKRQMWEKEFAYLSGGKGSSKDWGHWPRPCQIPGHPFSPWTQKFGLLLSLSQLTSASNHASQEEEQSASAQLLPCPQDPDEFYINLKNTC